MAEAKWFDNGIILSASASKRMVVTLEVRITFFCTPLEPQGIKGECHTVLGKVLEALALTNQQTANIDRALEKDVSNQKVR